MVYGSSFQSCSVKKWFVEISQNSRKSSCVRVSSLIKLQPSQNGQTHSIRRLLLILLVLLTVMIYRHCKFLYLTDLVVLLISWFTLITDIITRFIVTNIAPLIAQVFFNFPLFCNWQVADLYLLAWKILEFLLV